MRVLPFRSVAAATLALALVAAPALAQQAEKVDPTVIAKIRDEGMNRSQVMEIASWLTDVYGPRLAGSPNIRKAGEYSVGLMQKWGIANPRLENFGDFGRGWSNERFHAQVLEPTPYPVIAYPGAWSDGTKGTQVGEVVFVATQETPAAVEALRSTIRGKWVMMQPARDTFTQTFRADAQRHSDSALVSMTRAWETFNPAAVQQQGGRGGAPAGGARGRGAGPGAARTPAQEAAAALTALIDQEALGVLRVARGNDGTAFVQGSGSRAVNAPRSAPQIFLITEHYGRIFRTITKGVPVKLEINATNRFYTAPNELVGFNVLGEIPGTDPRLREQVVMLGGHFDSWHTGTGATDNAAGSATMLEALRILKTLNLPMKRTVRIGLWGAEEQGLIGSRQYVRQAFGYRDSTGDRFTPAHKNFQAYFNVDNGGGAIRGVYLQQNDALGKIFQQWAEPLKEFGTFAINRGNTGGTDHQSFDGLGLPGFQFVQDGLDYNTRTHHSNMDVYEKLIPADMKRNAVIVAAFVYLAANRDELLPRKPQVTQAGR